MAIDVHFFPWRPSPPPAPPSPYPKPAPRQCVTQTDTNELLPSISWNCWLFLTGELICSMCASTMTASQGLTGLHSPQFISHIAYSTYKIKMEFRTALFFYLCIIFPFLNITLRKKLTFLAQSIIGFVRTYF